MKSQKSGDPPFAYAAAKPPRHKEDAMRMDLPTRRYLPRCSSPQRTVAIFRAAARRSAPSLSSVLQLAAAHRRYLPRYSSPQRTALIKTAAVAEAMTSHGLYCVSSRRVAC